jgi:beta-glucanase (GH16 family)
MRAKLPSARGTWPAFWMLGEDIGRVGWPRCGEIDVMEHVGHDPNVVHSTVHLLAGDTNKHWSKGQQIRVPDAATAFHVYAAEWYPDRIDFFLDDTKYHTFPYQGPSKWGFDRRCYLLLNLAIGGNWGGPKRRGRVRLSAALRRRVRARISASPVTGASASCSNRSTRQTKPSIF